MTGYGPFLRLLLRTGWVSVVSWPVALVALLVTTAAKLTGMYPTQQGRDAYAAAYASVTGTSALQGRGYDLTNLGGMLCQELGFVMLLLIPVAGIDLGTRFTRGIEDSGQLDLLTAGRVGRLTPLVAGATITAVSAALSEILSLAGLLALGYPPIGALRYAAALALFLVASAAIGLLAGQLCQNAYHGYGLGLSAAMASYLLRAVIDARHLNATWTNPQSWLAEVRPFAQHPPIWPWLAYLGAVLALSALTLRIASRRDLGAGVLTPRPGPAQAASWIGGSAGLIVRLTRGNVIAWHLGSGVFALTFALLARDMQRLSQGAGVGRAGGSGLNTILVLYVQINALFAGAVAVQTMQAVAREERAGRTGWALATTVTRRRWWGAAAGVATSWSLLTLAWTGALTGAGLWAGSHRFTDFRHGVEATLAYTPAVLLVVAIALLLTAATPAATAATWLVLGWSLIVSFLDEPLRLHPWLRDLSPLEWIGHVPLDAWNRAAALGMVTLAAAALPLSRALYHQRDLAKR